MRNLKKLLALVLAMGMTFSLMLTAGASNVKKTYTDSEQITKEFTEAVDVLTGLGVFQGDEKGFRPGDTITRAEVATIIYRIATGDVDGNQVKIYADYSNFTDVNRDDWFAGAVGYCQNAGYIKGNTPTTFQPYGQVTGYEALAMILRVVGYDKNHEFEGATWQVNVASLSKELGITDNVKNANFETTLNMSARRDVVADLLFQTAAWVPTVTYTPALSYNDKTTITGSEFNPTLGEKTFDLDYSEYTTVDKWGRPGYYWFQDTKGDGKWVPSGNGKNIVATIIPEPEKTYTTTIRECDLAHDLDISTSITFDLYVNDNEPITENYLVVATDTVTKVGGQGRLTEVYRGLRNAKGSVDDRVVMVDTFLAQVTGVSNAVLDAAGHVIIPAKLTVNLYDQEQDSATPTTPNPSTPRVISKASTDPTNWEYAAGDMILLNAWTDHDGIQDSADDPDDADDTLHTVGETARNKAAFESEQVKLVDHPNFPTNDGAPLKETSDVSTNPQMTDVAYAEVLGVAKSQVAKQTVVYWNQEKHSVGGTDYPDQLDLFLDVAGTTTNSDFTWYFDQYGNIIGIGEAVKSTYGVITSLYSSFGQGDASTDGTAVARAHVKYADGTEGDITIERFLTSVGGTGSNPGDAVGYHNTAGTDMTVASGSAELIPVYDYNYGSTTVDSVTMTGIMNPAGYTKASNVTVGGHLYVAPVASVNKNIEGNTNTNPYFGIIEDNLFKFVTGGDNKVTAIEVAGKDNDNVYVNNYNGTLATDANNGNDADIAARTLYKNGYVSVNTPNVTVRMDNNTQIIVKEGTKINVYNGLSDLKGNVICNSGSEIDWADPDNDGIAEVVYVTGAVKGTVVYGLFYYNNGAGQWNGADKKGTLQGYLNGEAATLTFDNQNEFNAVKNSAAYGGHLFAVQITNDEVTNLMGDSTASDPKEKFLQAICNDSDSGATTLASLGLNDGYTSGNFDVTNTNEFVTGVLGGNDYTANTKAVWLHDYSINDDTTVAGYPTNPFITYDAVRSVVKVDTVEYSLTGASKILGDDLSYLNLENRTNDITIVYEGNTIKSIVEIYVTTLPDVTPGVDDGVVYTAVWKVDSNDLKVTVTNESNASATDAVTVKVYARNVGADRSKAQLVGTATDTLSGGTADVAAVTKPNNALLYYAEVYVGNTLVATTDDIIGLNS